MAVAAREALLDVIPTPLTPSARPQPVPTTSTSVCAHLASALIVRWEVTSPAVYTRRYEGVIWPGGVSGPTWGIGYDGGHQTRQHIASTWHAHPAMPALFTTAGAVGASAQARVNAGEWRAALTPYPYAVDVFTLYTLPAYTAAARRALGPDHFDALPCGAQAGLVSLGYNRGWSLLGPKRVEMAAIVRVCAPRRDIACIAHQIRAMKRHWPAVKGLQARREDEARHVETST